ncbi:MAG TPA: redox-regulated ATPase YchF [Nitrospiria bacterium]|nr:redox-regulated ATPase YchF [Nitrospiria bacterium]
MALKCGIIGLPNVGKSTIFNAMTSAHAIIANYPFTTIEPNIGMVEVPDERLSKLALIYTHKKVTPAIVEFVDIAGLVKGASKGEGLGNKFLAHIRNVDSILHIVRCFKDPDVAHISGELNPIEDINLIRTELLLADLEIIERQLIAVQKRIKRGDKEAARETALLEKIKMALETGSNLDIKDLPEAELEYLRTYNLITVKPVLYVVNTGEGDIESSNLYIEQIRELVNKEDVQVTQIIGRLEAEIALLPREERDSFMKELGLLESGLSRLIKASYRLLGLITFFTVVGGEEIRAWTILDGTKAASAAGKIHTDMEKGFIKAEVIHFQDLVLHGTPEAVREKGLLRIEGRDYVVKDGDIIHFRFAL